MTNLKPVRVARCLNAWRRRESESTATRTQSAQQKMRRRRWSNRYGPWAVVTGASDGIGRAFALGIASRGVNVALAARRADRLEDLAQGICERFRVSTRVVPADFATPSGVERLRAEIRDLDCGLLVRLRQFVRPVPRSPSTVSSKCSPSTAVLRSRWRMRLALA